MFAKRYSCTLKSRQWLTPTVMEIVLTSTRRIPYQGGQFLALELPGGIKRAFSFATGPAHASQHGISLCVRYQSGGKASEYLKQLPLGSPITLHAPYGDFVIDRERLTTESDTRALCLISTGTGVAPLYAMAQDLYESGELPTQVLNLFGCQNREELLYANEFRSMGIASIYALTREADLSGLTVGRDRVFEGRVTDFMKALPYEWPWHSTDYYICGNPEMVKSAESHLQGRGVARDAIHTELFLPPSTRNFEETTLSTVDLVLPPDMQAKREANRQARKTIKKSA